MEQGRRILAVIPARGGSKGLPGKNLAELGGKPLIAWAIEAALAAETIDRVVFSSEDAELMAAAAGFGGTVVFPRPAELATDEASIYDVLFHVLDGIGEAFDDVVLLQPTTPLRTAADIDAAVRRRLAAGAPACVTVTDPVEPPGRFYAMDGGGRLVPLMPQYASISRRQELPPAVVPNGAVYVADVAWLRTSRTFYGPETVGLPMPRDRSVDIDCAMDLLIARALLAARSSP
ncbi:MAG: cytidylyltransferase domain-containing protein [Actinomycetota bacterium]